MKNPKQCISKDRLKDVRCQGVPGHKGCHWAYDESGQLIRWKNKKEKDPEWKNTACIWTPSTHKTWISPIVMDKYYYMTIWAKGLKDDKTGND